MCAAIFLTVIAAMLYGSSARARPTPIPAPSRVLAASIATAVILVVFLVVSVATGKAVSIFSSDQGVVVQVTGHQWWWEFRYPDQDPARTVVTANEIHIPAGRPVLLRGTACNSQLVESQPERQARSDPVAHYDPVDPGGPAGRLRAQCAEYCGLQHAHMSFYVVAEAPEHFSAWLEPENLVRWIRNPKEVDSKTAMPNMNVSESDARDIAG